MHTGFCGIDGSQLHGRMAYGSLARQSHRAFLIVVYSGSPYGNNCASVTIVATPRFQLALLELCFLTASHISFLPYSAGTSFFLTSINNYENISMYCHSCLPILLPHSCFPNLAGIYKKNRTSLDRCYRERKALGVLLPGKRERLGELYGGNRRFDELC
jgi:hypothetical protein